MPHGRVTLAGFALYPPDTTAPTAPSDLSAIAGDASATLSWTAASDNVGVTGYKVYKNGVYEKTASTTNTTVTGLTNYTTYSFTVTSIDAAGNESAASAAAAATPEVTYSKDTFTRAASLSLGSTETGGYAWEAEPSTDAAKWDLSGTSLRKLSGQALAEPKSLLINDGHADGTISAKLLSGTTASIGIVFRVANDGASGFLFSRLSSTGVYSLKRRSGSTYTTLWTQSTGSGAAGDVAKVVLNGSSIKVYVNDVLMFSTTDTVNQTATRHGVYAASTVVTSFDDWLHTGATS